MRGAVSSAGGGQSPAVILANAHWVRVLADGGVFPEGNTMTDYNNLLSAIESLIDIYDSPNLSDKLYATYDPHVFGVKVGAGSGSTAGMAVQKLYSLQGAASDVIQSTAANQPLLLRWNSTDGNYFFNAPNVASNNATTPSSVANNITGDIDIDARVKWSAGTMYMCDRRNGTNQFTFLVFQGGSLRFIFYNGVSAETISSTATISAGISYYRVKRIAATGVVTFYTSTDGTTWSQLGATVASTVGNLTSVAGQPIRIGSTGSGVGSAGCHLFSMRLYNGDRDAGGTLVNNFRASDYNVATAQTTLTSGTTGEVWTINQGAALSDYKATLVYRTVCQFDQTNDNLKSAAFTLNQPSTVYGSLRQLSWNSLRTLIDGDAINTMRLYQNVGTPALYMTSDNVNTLNTSGAAVGRWKLLTMKFNGASGSLQVNDGVATTGNVGTGNAGGVTIGSLGDSTLPSNMAFQSLVIAKQSDGATIATAMASLIRGTWGSNYAN